VVKVAAERVRARRTGLQVSSSYDSPAAQDVSAREAERDRLLARHRNAFVNVAGPMLAFAQPVPAEVLGGVSAAGAVSSSNRQGFTLWDALEVRVPSDSDSESDSDLEKQLQAVAPVGESKTAATLTVADIETFLQQRVGAALQSLSAGDLLLYARFVCLLLSR